MPLSPSRVRVPTESPSVSLTGIEWRVIREFERTGQSLF
jgi:hypothetical protein